MKCKRCDYPLWDMAARVCPECGLGFSPEDYTFVINSVRFMCPHCRQDYYGTGEGGHLVPPRFVCVKCGVPVSEAQMIVMPTVGVSEVQTVGGVVAWREKRRNIFWRFFVTVGQAAFMPHRLARFCGEETRPWEACVFGALAIGLYVLGAVGWCGVLFSFMGTQRLGMQAQFGDIMQAIGTMALWFLVPIAAGMAATAVWAGSAHVVLMVGNPRPVTWGKTMESFAYAAGAGFLVALPCAGIYMSPLAAAWVAVSVIIQLTVRQRVTPGRAVLAGLLLPALVVLGVIGWIAIAASVH